MAYVSEYISKDDLKKYKIREIESMGHPSFYSSNDWTIDRERYVA